jgi:hypothetical protein
MADLSSTAASSHATQTDGVFDLCYRSHRLAQIDLRQTVANPSTMSPYTCSP